MATIPVEMTARKTFPDPSPGEHPIVTYRRKKDLSQREFAIRAGTTPSTLSRIEAGTLRPSTKTMRKLIAAAGGKLKAEALVNWVPPDGDSRRAAA